MSYIIRSRCPNGCKYKIGYTCVAGECPYQIPGGVRYDIRLNAEEDKPTKINAQVKKAVKEFAEKVKEKALSHCRTINCYELTFIETTIDELLKEYEE